MKTSRKHLEKFAPRKTSILKAICLLAPLPLFATEASLELGQVESLPAPAISSTAEDRRISLAVLGQITDLEQNQHCQLTMSEVETKKGGNSAIYETAKFQVPGDNTRPFTISNDYQYFTSGTGEFVISKEPDSQGQYSLQYEGPYRGFNKVAIELKADADGSIDTAVIKELEYKYECAGIFLGLFCLGQGAFYSTGNQIQLHSCSR